MVVSLPVCVITSLLSSQNGTGACSRKGGKISHEVSSITRFTLLNSLVSRTLSNKCSRQRRTHYLIRPLSLIRFQLRFVCLFVFFFSLLDRRSTTLPFVVCPVDLNLQMHRDLTHRCCCKYSAL